MLHPGFQPEVEPPVEAFVRMHKTRTTHSGLRLRSPREHIRFHKPTAVSGP